MAPMCTHVTFRLLRNASLFRKPMARYISGSEMAQEYFDVTYRNAYGAQWPSLRLALLCKNKLVTILNNHHPRMNETLHELQNLGCFDSGKYYRSVCAETEQEVVLTRKNRVARRRRRAVHDLPDQDVEVKQKDFRPPLRAMTDEEKTQLETTPPSPLYPDEFRRSSVFETQDVRQRPGPDRIILPSDAGLGLSRSIYADLPIEGLASYVPANTLKGLEDFISEQYIFEKYKIDSKPGEGDAINIEKINGYLSWPEMLNILAFSRCDISNFTKPEKRSNLIDHFPTCGSNILPVILLGINPGDHVLDMCAANFVNTHLILQTCLAESLLSCTPTLQQAEIISSLLLKHYSKHSPVLSSHSASDITSEELLNAGNEFDKILVDAPCLEDRFSLMNSSNIFLRSQLQARMDLPDIEANLLLNALKLLRVGGAVVYTTCSLSPLHNDGAVHIALHRLWDTTNIKCTVVDWSDAVKPFDFMFKFGGEDLGIKYGQMVLPFLPNNYGPRYCAKIIRTK